MDLIQRVSARWWQRLQADARRFFHCRRRGAYARPEKIMLVSAVLWHVLLGCFAFVDTAEMGIPLLGLIGFVSSLAMVPMSSSLCSPYRLPSALVSWAFVSWRCLGCRLGFRERLPHRSLRCRR